MILSILFSSISVLESNTMRSSVQIKPITSPVQHSEGPYWDPKYGLYYTDTFNATAYKWNYKSNTVSSYKLADRNSIGVIIPIKDRTSEFIIGADRYLYKLIWDINEEHSEELLMIEENKPSNQYNDGKVDSKGRLWIGTLTRNPDLSVTDNGGSLYMIKGDDLPNFEEKITPTSISNGLAWSKDNKHFYYIDSTTRKVVVYDFHEETGKLDCKRVLFDLEEHPNLQGIPDGMTIDSDDNLWIALFGGHSIINVDSNSGALKKVIRMPVSYVTSACFGGPKLNILYVTTSKLHVDESQLEDEPLAGSVFAITNLGVKGLPCNEFILNNSCRCQK